MGPYGNGEDMATIDQYATKNGVMFRVRVRRKGSAPQAATFKKLVDAKKFANMIEGQIVEGRHFPQQKYTYTVQQMLERYATDVMPQKRPSTIPTQLQHLHWWKNHIGSLSLNEVRPSTILQYRDTLKKTKSNATV